MSFLSDLRERDYRISVTDSARELGWTVEEYEETLESLTEKGYSIDAGMTIRGELCVVLNDPEFIDTQDGGAIKSPSSCPFHDQS